MIDLDKTEVEAMQLIFKRLIMQRKAIIQSLYTSEQAFYQIPSKAFIDGLELSGSDIKAIAFVKEVLRTSEDALFQLEMVGATGLMRYYFVVETESQKIGLNIPVKDFIKFNILYDIALQEVDIQFVFRSEITIGFEDDSDPDLVELLKRKKLILRGNKQAFHIWLEYKIPKNWIKVLTDLKDLKELGKPYIEVTKTKLRLTTKL